MFGKFLGYFREWKREFFDITKIDSLLHVKIILFGSKSWSEKLKMRKYFLKLKEKNVKCKENVLIG